MFAVRNNKKCPVEACNVNKKKRSAEMKNNDALFYLAVDNVRSSSGKPLFKKAPVGVKNANENNGTECRT